MGKECNHLGFLRFVPLGWSAVVVALVLFEPQPVAAGQNVRLWPQAVVIEDQVRLGDLCALNDFSITDQQQLEQTTVVEAPPPGGSRAVTLDQIRKVLSEHGTNMAVTIVKGALECKVTRPRAVVVGKPEAGDDRPTEQKEPRNQRMSLGQAVISAFETKLARYNGHVEVDFGPRVGAQLELSGDQYSFVVRRRTGRLLGLVEVQVEIRCDGETAQTIELQPIVRFSRDVVVARRAINHQAQIRQQDLQLSRVQFDRLDKLGLTELERVVGQRAKHFIPSGTMVEACDLEAMPLVLRGQLVDVYSQQGGVTIVTTVKAMDNGSYGDVVELVSGDHSGQRLKGLVTGPRRVELTGAPAAAEDRVASRLRYREGDRR